MAMGRAHFCQLITPRCFRSVTSVSPWLFLAVPRGPSVRSVKSVVPLGSSRELPIREKENENEKENEAAAAPDS